MADYEEAFGFLMLDEDPKLSGKVTYDQGGRTRFGIAEKFSAIIGTDFYTMPAAAALERAKEFYRYREWSYIKGEDITSNAVADKLLNLAANVGQKEQVILLQRVLNEMNGNDNLAQDGIVGPMTLQAVNSVDPVELVHRLCIEAGLHYGKILDVHPEWENDRKNWMGRANRLPPGVPVADQDQDA